MNPREELLAAVAVLDRQLSRQEEYALPETRIVRDWLRLEADQHGHVLGGEVSFWAAPWWTEEVLALQPCIQMARLINGTGEA